MGRQVQIGVLEVPHIIGQDIQPDHIGPQHIFLIFGSVDTPPAGHAEDVDDTGSAVEPVPPATIQPDIFAGQPPAVGRKGTLDAGFEVADHSNQNIGGHDQEGEHLEPIRFADGPLVFQHHKADAAQCRGIELEIMEPAVHVDIGGIIQRPLGTHSSAYINGDKVNSQTCGQNQEAGNAAPFCPACKFIGESQTHKYHQPAKKLETGGFAINLE